ncbi:hypothetical protein [Streptomyces sp. enrichment culture]|uniref:hypothetical protein n=1 Tax=Streptomyces sp. enrichment culture TaxID=1795815 RepID=UPI003F579D1E
MDASPESLIAWGIDGTSDLLCWLAEGDDPERWRVAVYSRGIDGWVFTDCGMAEFLYRALGGEFADVLTGVSRRDRPPRFLTDAERKRIAATGRDPWA